MSGKRKAPRYILPTGVYEVRSKGKIYFYWQVRRGRPNQSPRIRIPYETRDPRFWEMANRLNDDGEAHPGTFKALVALYRKSPRFTKRPKSTQDTYSVALKTIEKSWSHLRVSEIVPRHVYALQSKLADRPAAANLTVRVLRVLLKEGIKLGYCIFNAARDIEALPEVGNGSAPWPDDAFDFVLEHAPQHLARAVVLARATGQRGVDLVKMRPADRRENGLDMLIQKLGNERHFCPLTQDALAAIDGWGEEKMIPYINMGGKRISEDKLRAEWKAFKNLHPDHIPQDITLHDLRASAICDRRLAGVPHQQIADQICMSLGMVIRYSKHIDKEVNAKAGMAALERAENARVKNLFAPNVKPKG